MASITVALRGRLVLQAPPAPLRFEGNGTPSFDDVSTWLAFGCSVERCLGNTRKAELLTCHPRQRTAALGLVLSNLRNEWGARPSLGCGHVGQAGELRVHGALGVHGESRRDQVDRPVASGREARAALSKAMRHGSPFMLTAPRREHELTDIARR